MSTAISRDDLLSAFDWVSSSQSAGMDGEAYIDRATGQIHWIGEGVDEEPPDDLEDGSRYIAVPTKSEFELGRELALQFVEQRLLHELQTVQGYFRQRGAYAKFKTLLDRAGLLHEWHAYEQAATETALAEWCAEVGFKLEP